MRAIIAAGGHGTRIRPITWTLNKHLVPLANKPMIVHAIEKVKTAGITDIYINVNPGDTEMAQALGDGSQFGVDLTYVEQQGGPKGVAHIPKNAEQFLAGEPFLFYLGDNIILGDLKQFVERFEKEQLDCMLAFSRVADPRQFGVPVFSADGSLKKIEEKPDKPASDFAVTGIYLYSPAFFEAYDEITPSDRGEYEISDINTWYIEKGKKVDWQEITGWWKDTGKPEDLLEGNALIMKEMPRDAFKIQGKVSSLARVQGLVHVGEGSTIGPNTLIRGPVVIGDNCTIKNAYLGPYTSVGNDVTIDGSEIEHSIVLDRSLVTAKARLIDTILGRDTSVVSKQTTQPASGHHLVIGDRSHVEL